MTDESKQMNEVRACFGLVIYNVQLLEQQLVCMLVAADLHNKYQFSKKNPEELFGEKFNSTITAYIPEIRDAYHLDNETLNCIDQSMKLRNVFSFRYFGRRTKDLFSDEGRQKMIKELEKASLTFTQTNNLLKENFNRYLRDNRLFKVQIDEIVNRLFSK